MAGQSNMQGHGNVGPVDQPGTLSHFIANGGATEFDYIQNSNASWATRDDVWVRYDHENGELLTGALSIGFGSEDMQIGPEFGFGHLLGAHTDDQVLIIKTCWGGKSLAVDFRPPSSGGNIGPYYTTMINDIREAISNIATEFPQYSGGEIEIAGFSWFQGWNDGDDQSYIDEYEQNLINLIADVRAEFNVPNLPVVIGLTGNGGREIEEGDGWINRLQTQIVPAQIRAAEYSGHSNVDYIETRDYWFAGDLSPEPDFLHHWNNNAESYLRIGNAMGEKMIDLLDTATVIVTPSGSLGSIRPNTNPALPSAYNFQEYVFPEPDDQGECLEIENMTAVIEKVFLSQTHRHAIGHPLLFTIGERPALIQVAVTGTGSAPDVQVEGILDGNSLGTLCLNGPADLSMSVNLKEPNFRDFFSVTLPKAWIKIGLEVKLTVGNEELTLSQDDLQITPYTELNLVLVNMDIMDYNHEPHRTPAFDDFLQELASAIPASVVRFGKFPETLRLADFALNNIDDNTVVVNSDEMLGESGLNTGNINFFANIFLDKMRQSIGDSPNTVFFGNTLNLDPGGWGGGGSFVSFEYNDIFIHELGHALSLPHWGEDYRRINPDAYQYSYPYKGEEGEGSGRGEAWNFIQDIYEFVSPTCEDENGIVGTERSDCMERGFSCIETRSDGPGPWDGFGDFSAKAMNDYLLGSTPYSGQVEDRGELIDFHFRQHDGFPIASLVDGKRVFTRHPSQPENTYAEEFIKLPGEEQIEQDVYLVYGSAHSTLSAANILYEPIKYKGTLLPILNPTDPDMFSVLKNLAFEDAPEFFGRARDITLKLTYIDGTVSHALVPFQSFDRPEDFPEESPRPEYFAINVPGDKLLCGVEMYHRDFIVLYDDVSEPGNINDPTQNITAANFMDEARLMATLDHSCNCPGTANFVEPGTPCDGGNPLTINDVEDGSCNCIGETIEPCGLIKNGSFAESTFTWRSWGSEFSSVDGEAYLSEINEFDSGIAQGPFTLTENESYKINFDAYSESARSMDIIVYLDEEPYTEYFRETIDLNTAEESFQRIFTFDNPTTANASVEFRFDGSSSSIFLDDICLDIACAGAIEIPYNGIDDDCNAETPDDDLDQDGYDSSYDCDDNDPDVNPGATEISYNGIDDDCYPFTLDDDLDEDGYLQVDDCDDLNPDINPGQNEIPGNGIDENCDNLDLISSVNEVEQIDVLVYPNPTSDLLYIKIREDIDFTATLYDTNARLIKSIFNERIINLSSIPSGSYYLEIQDIKTGQKIFKKVVIAI